MGAGALLGLVALSGLAAWKQTPTGFAFGLIMMGGIGLTGLVPLTATAVLVSILVLVNPAQMLAQGCRDIALPEFRLILAASFVALPAGYWLLEALASTSLGALRLALGCVIMASSLQLALAPAPLSRRSPPASFLFFGAVTGLMGGLSYVASIALSPSGSLGAEVWRCAITTVASMRRRHGISEVSRGDCLKSCRESPSPPRSERLFRSRQLSRERYLGE